MVYEYYINLDERGEFYADVRDPNGETIWVINTELAQELNEDGFLQDPRHAGDVGLYLKDIGILPDMAELKRAN
jgi:hypothetical protein